MLLATLVNMELRLVPSSVTTVMMTAAMSATSRPYSTAVAPLGGLAETLLRDEDERGEVSGNGVHVGSPFSTVTGPERSVMSPGSFPSEGPPEL